MSSKINATTTSGLTSSGDNTGVLELQANGVTQITIDSTGAYGIVERATVQNSTSGTFIDFTGIPAWAKRITVMFNGVSTSGTGSLLIQLGSGSPTTSGYLGTNSLLGTGVSSTILSSGFLFSMGAADTAAGLRSGLVTFGNITGAVWSGQGTLSTSNAGAVSVTGGAVTLAGVLDRIRITTTNGTDTFDAGSINILYEG